MYIVVTNLCKMPEISKKTAPGKPASQPIQQMPNPVISLKPTDFTLPHSLDAMFPGIESLRKLKEAEKKLDAYATRKWLDLQELIPETKKESLVLRVFIYNTCTNQLWQKEEMKQKGETVDEIASPAWTLVIEGRLLNDPEPIESENRKKFNEYFTGISVDLDKNSKFEATEPSSPNPSIIEWHERTSKSKFDGINIARHGSENVKCKITLQPKELPNKFQLEYPLAQLLGSNELTEKDAVYGVWQYILINKLLDSKDKRLIHCDVYLQAALGVQKFYFPELIVLVKKLLKPVPPIVIDYEIDTLKSSTLGEVVVDISIENIQPLLDPQLIESLNNKKDLFFKNDTIMKDLDAKIVLDIQSLNASKTKYEFYKSFSEDPITFLENWQESHAKALKILAGDESYTEEAARRSEFYTDELLQENIDFLLNSKRTV